MEEEGGGGRGQGGCSPLISGSLISPFPCVTSDDVINGGRGIMGVCRGVPGIALVLVVSLAQMEWSRSALARPGPELIY